LIKYGTSVLAVGRFGLKASGSILRTDERWLLPPW